MGRLQIARGRPPGPPPGCTFSLSAAEGAREALGAQEPKGAQSGAGERRGRTWGGARRPGGPRPQSVRSSGQSGWHPRAGSRQLEAGPLPAGSSERAGWQARKARPSAMIPLEKPGSGGSSPAVASGSGRAGRGLSTPRRPPPPTQARGLLTEIRTAVRTEPFQDAYTLTPGRELGR